MTAAALSPPATDGLAASGAARSIFVVASGNFLEMFDFMVFAYYATDIAKAFFPAGSEIASLLLTLMTFGAGFLMRPVGAMVLGAYLDRYGRRRGLLLTLGLMALGTFAIAVTPGYARIGLAAPAIVLIGRLVQGLSAGVELGGVSVYLAEIAPPGRAGFFCAWQSASQQVAVMAAALIGLVVTGAIGPAAMHAWGWRIPFLFGCLLVPFLFAIRRHMAESGAPHGSGHGPAAVLRSVGDSWRVVLRGGLMAVMTTVFFYMVTAYTPTFGTQVLHLRPTESLVVTLAVGGANFALLPTSGALSDRIGRRPLLLGATLAGILLAYPLMRWLVAAPSFGRLLTVEVTLAAIYATYNGAFIVYLTELVPPRARTMAFSLAYSLATAIFGGFTPAIGTALIGLTGDRAIPGAWCAVAAALALGALLAGRKARVFPASPDR